MARTTMMPRLSSLDEFVPGNLSVGELLAIINGEVQYDDVDIPSAIDILLDKADEGLLEAIIDGETIIYSNVPKREALEKYKEVCQNSRKIGGKKLIEYFPPYTGQMYTIDAVYGESGYIGNFNLDYILSSAIMDNASDIHIVLDGRPVAFSVLGDIKYKKEFNFIDSSDRDGVASNILRCILSSEQYNYFNANRELDISYSIKRGPYKDRRFRLNVGESFGFPYLTFRTISDKIPSPDDLKVEPEIREWFKYNSGVVIIGGATGTGKSTTLASLIRQIQISMPKKIVTIEKPIEYIYPISDGLGYVVQREVGADCLSFENGLTSAMRQAPNVILIGEIRDKTEASELVRASETGHLALTTVHTTSVWGTITRIISLYPPEEQSMASSILADTVRGLANQVLVKTADGESRIAVREYLTVTDDIRKLIAKQDIQSIRDIMIERKATIEHKLVELSRMGTITKETARLHAGEVELFDLIEQGKL